MERRRAARRARLVAVAVVAVAAAGCARPVVVPPLATSGSTPPAASASATGAEARRCAEPPAGAEPVAVPPASVDLDPGLVEQAVGYATARGALSVRVQRRGCLVATSGWDAATGSALLPAWSMTKSVVAVAVGRAAQLGLVSVDDPIGRHLQVADPAKAALTIRHFLTQTSGLRMAWASDLLEAASADSVASVLARPFEAVPGTTYNYAQTAVTVLVAVVEAAAGEDFQRFVARELFTPIGIGAGEWRWGRDSVGRTHGFFALDIAPRAMARIGQLLLQDGSWAGRRLLAPGFVDEARAGTAANPCYGFLIWTNAGETCRSSFPAPELQDRRWSPALPPDAFGFGGLFDQQVVIVPSLELVAVRMGLPNQAFGDPIGEAPGDRPEWTHRFHRFLGQAVTDVSVPDPGDWTAPPPPPPVDWLHIFPVPLPEPWPQPGDDGRVAPPPAPA